MAYCGKCGTQLSEGAKFCPKCGNPIRTTQNEKETRIEREIPNESFTENEEAEEEGLSSLEKIALGAAGVIAIFGICYGAFESHYIVTISILAIVAIGYSFIGGIERKYIWTTVLGSIVAVFLAMGVFSSDNKEEEKTQVEQKQETPAEKAAREKKEQADREENEKQEKIKRVAEIAYKMGYDRRKATWGQTIASEDATAAEYRFRYAVDPEDAGQSERWNVFRENYSKGFSDAADEIINKFRKEDF